MLYSEFFGLMKMLYKLTYNVLWLHDVAEKDKTEFPINHEVAILCNHRYHFGFLNSNKMKRKYKYYGSDGNGGFMNP